MDNKIDLNNSFFLMKVIFAMVRIVLLNHVIFKNVCRSGTNGLKETVNFRANNVAVEKKLLREHVQGHSDVLARSLEFKAVIRLVQVGYI